MDQKNGNSDILLEASRMLSEPSRDTRRKILISMNAVFIAILALFLAIQLIQTGTLPDPVRDLLVYPIIILTNALSLIYNLRVLLQKREASAKKDKLSAWATVGITMFLSLVIVHTNANTATSMLVDFGMSVVTLFVTGIVIGRRAAVGWFLISAASLYMAYQNVGTAFEYHLLTQEEVTAFKQALEGEDAEAQAIFNKRVEQKLTPLPASLYATVWFVFLAFGFLAIYFESNMISQVLRAIPPVIEKINIAGQQKNKLEQENMRMGMELDVARKIQMMMLPGAIEFESCNGIEIAAHMEPASEVGGDFYECLPQADGSVILAIGDVTDHGLQSGLVMLMAQSTIRTTLDNTGLSLTEALCKVNNILYHNIQDRMKDQRNLTLSLMRVNGNAFSLCGQHESVYYYNSAQDELQQISTMDLGMYIGMIADVSPHVQEIKFKLNKDDILLFYTDGLTEAENANGEFYGDDRLKNILFENKKCSASQLVDKLREDVHRFIGQTALMDDISILALKYIG